MPGLSDDMYCSEQICIPPSFPYLLRQYAKAAIRTQPMDLLKWSTAYFRCLSLSIPPPVKVRLEYPVPRDFFGITPGWLKALIYQLRNNKTISFKILWDRWIGACLQHNTLIQLLCLGGFDNVEAIPWLRLVAICAGTLSDDLTHTMILICEILTEEPEGGSAMIPLETFVDLYKFLAKIDASQGQTLKNFWFRDSLLSLYREKVEKVEVEEELHEEFIAVSEESVASKATSESLAKSDDKGDMEKVVSCPSLPEDDQYSLDYLLKEIPGEGDVEEEEQVEEPVEMVGEDGGMKEEEEHLSEKRASGEEEEEKEKVDVDGDGDDKKELEKAESDKSEEQEGDLEWQAKVAQDDIALEEQIDKSRSVQVTEQKEEETVAEVQEKPAEESDLKDYTSVESIADQPVRDLTQKHLFEDDITLKEDLERLRALQLELAGETDEELEKFKCRLIEEMPLTESQEIGIKHFKIDTDKLEHHSSEEKLKIISGEKLRRGEASSESHEEEGDKKTYDEVYVEAIPGIGPIVPEHLIDAVVEYMKSCAKIQHGMVMPRNIRHYSCPPLEVMEY